MANKILLLCGHRVVQRIKPLLASNDINLVLRIANNKAGILSQLKQDRPSICIIEHDFGFIEMAEQFKSNLIAMYFGGIFKLFKNKSTSVEEFKACDLLPEMIQASPGTRYVITSHIRGSGVTKEEKAIYKKIPEVIKVMGFINSNTNANYLLKVFEKMG